MDIYRNLKIWFLPIFIVLCVSVFLPTGAFDSKVEAELKYSRDELVKQKTDLEIDLEQKAKQVAQLEMEIQKVRANLKDTDHALNMIDTTLKVRH